MTRIAFAMFLLPSIALAEQPIVVEDFQGPSSGAVRTQVVRAIDRSPDLVVADDGETIVSGRVVRAGRRWRARITARTTDGETIATRGFTARRVGALTGIVRSWVHEELVPALAGGAPSAPEPVPVARVEAREAPRPEPERAPAREEATLPPPIAIGAGLSVVHRSFTYNDDVFEALRPYELPAAPMLHASLEWFPGAHADLGIMRGLSIIAEGELALGVESEEGAQRFGTDLYSVHAGARWLLDVDDVAFRIDAGYRAFVFAIHTAADGQTRAELPNVEIHAIRAGAAFRWDIGVGLFFTGQAAYLQPLALGEIASAAWFPRATAGGVEGDLGMGLRVDDVELRSVFAFRRFFYDMHSEPGDARVAGGAVDEYLSGALFFSYTPGS